MPEMKNRHVDLRSKKPAEGGRDFGIAGFGELPWRVAIGWWRLNVRRLVAGLTVTWLSVPGSAVDQAGLYGTQAHKL